MFQGDELLNPCRVPAGLKVHAPERVGYAFGHSICLDSMPEQRGDGLGWNQLRPEFLMAARGQENQLGLRGDSAINRVVGRGIAGVQGDYDIDAIQRNL